MSDLPSGALKGLPLAWISVLVTVAGFAHLQLLALMSTGGAFEYPLDDVYIHLSMAEQIARGGYGLNPGEITSASSSPLFPLLLLPLGGPEWQRMLPLFWNAVGLVIAAWLWGRVLIASGYGAPGAGRADMALGFGLAAAGPILANFPGVGFIGLEHGLHLAASLAIVAGLVLLIQHGRIGWVLVCGIAFAPVLRFEGLALALLAVAVVAVQLGWCRALPLAFLAVVPVLAFSGFLVSLGLGPLPNSVEAKLVGPGEEHIGPFMRILTTFVTNAKTLAGMVLLALSTLALVTAPLVASARPLGTRWIAYAAGIAGIAHLAFARMDWLNRYETYIVATLILVLAAALRLPGRLDARRGLVLALTIGTATVSGWKYTTEGLFAARWAPRRVHLQQTEMARFIRDYAQRSVAVNDIGRVSWQNEYYVLDLWGLASDEARKLRLYSDDPHWAGPLAARRGVGLAMIYESWVGANIGQDWVLLGVHDIAIKRGFLGEYQVSFYATDPTLVPELTEALRAFAATLPEGTSFRFARPQG